MVLAGVLAALIGLSLGLLGGGGSILMLPTLVYVLGLEPRAAIASSLFVVGTTSAAGLALHARAGRVQWRVGLVVAAGGVAGAFAGGRLARLVPPMILLVAFGALMLVTALNMLRGRRAGAARAETLGTPRALALGAGVGLLAGLVGAGGGFLIVPALVGFAGLAMPEAVATSLLVIALQAFAGFAGQVTAVSLDVGLLAVVSVASTAGALTGALLAPRVRPEQLRAAFGWLVLGMGVVVLGRELPAPAGARGAVVALVGAAALVVGLAARREALTPARGRASGARA